MKGTWCWLLLLVSAGSGCVSLPVAWRAEKPAPAPTPAAPSAPPPVTADQVNETNAHEKSQALREELDREAPASR